MKVVCTVTNDLSQDQRMRRICTSLANAGHEVTLVGRRKPDSLPLSSAPFRQHRIACRRQSGKGFYLEYNWRLVRELTSWDFDVICAVDVDTLAAGASLARSGGRKLVFDAHEWFHLTPEVVNRPLIRGFWRGLARFLSPKADLRYTVARGLAGELEKDYGVPFATVRNLPRRQPPPPSRDVDRKIILYQGMLNPGRGIGPLIEAVHRVPEVELWIAGDGPEMGALRRCAERGTGAKRIRFLGFLPPEDLPALTRNAWLGVNLLDSTSPSYYFSLANKALDYLQAGLPSLQMDFPEYRHIHNMYGCYTLLPDLRVETIAGEIRRLADQPEVHRQLHKGCLRAAEDLCWEQEEQHLLRLWNSLGLP